MHPSTLPTVLAEICAEDPDGIGGFSFDAPLSVADVILTPDNR